MGLKSVVGKKAYTLGGKLPAPIQNLANKQILDDITAMPVNVAVTSVNKGTVGNFMPVPESITISIKNTNDEAVDVLFVNNGTYKPLLAGVEITYSDGFAGKLLDRYANGLQDANGILCYGFNARGYDADGAPSDEVLNNMQLAVMYYNGVGDLAVPLPIQMAGSERNTQWKDGLLTIKTQFVLNFLSQMRAHLGAGERVQLVLNFQPIEG